MRQFEFTYKLLGSGWADARVFADGCGNQMIISYLTDAPGDMVRAVIALFKMPEGGQVQFSWEDEPGEYRWTIERHGDTVAVKIVESQQNYSKLADDPWPLFFQTECSLLRLATQVRGQMQQIVNEYGLDRYRGQWSTYPFPIDELEQLSKLIVDSKRLDRRYRHEDEEDLGRQGANFKGA